MLEVRKEQPAGRPPRAEPAIYLQLADGSRYAQPGKIDFLDVRVNQGTDTVQVRAIFPNPDRILVDGQLVAVVAEAGKAKHALLVPQQALQLDQTGPYRSGRRQGQQGPGPAHRDSARGCAAPRGRAQGTDARASG